MSLVKRESRAVRPFEWWPTEDRFEQLVRDMFRGFGTALMKVEEYVDGDSWVLRAELPGLDPDEDVELTVADGMLRSEVRRIVRDADLDSDPDPLEDAVAELLSRLAEETAQALLLAGCRTARDARGIAVPTGPTGL